MQLTLNHPGVAIAIMNRRPDTKVAKRDSEGHTSLSNSKTFNMFKPATPYKSPEMSPTQ